MSGMKYDEFFDKLKQYKAEFLSARGKEMDTIAELDAFLHERKYGRKKDRALKSLKGMNL